MADKLIPQQVRTTIESDIAQRTKEHQGTIARLKAAEDQAHTFAEKIPLKTPLVLLAHGDSWFDYPLSGNDVTIGTTDVIAQLTSVGDAPPVILNISHYGDATTDEMSLPKQQRMITALRDTKNWMSSGKPDAILFSGGGNDIAGDQFCIFLNYAAPGVFGLNKDRFQEALGMVRASYLDLFDFRNRYAPGVPVFGHSYDFPIPNGAHPLCAGPWLLPSLQYCNWSVQEGTAIVKEALSEFCTMLKSLASDPNNNFILVPTQGLLKPQDWANELHPYPEGFKTIARAFLRTLSGRFPQRVDDLDMRIGA
jgi:hypothetical protein